MDIRIEDCNGLHNGYTLHIEPGYTALVGPNGAGKTTLLRQIRDYARSNGIRVWEYSDLYDGGDSAKDRYLLFGDMKKLASSVLASEGENIALNFADKVAELGKVVKKARDNGYPLFVLLDSLDSGASIDRLRNLMGLFDLIYADVLEGARVYLIVAVNQYELVKDPVDCVNVRTGEHIKFSSYYSYADFICTFEEEYRRVKKSKEW